MCDQGDAHGSTLCKLGTEKTREIHLFTTWPPTGQALHPRVEPNRLAEAPGDVILGARILGLREDRLRVVVLDEHARALSLAALADVEERGHVRDTRGLLHVVRDDDARVVVLELVHQVL